MERLAAAMHDYLAEPEWAIDAIVARTGHPRDLVMSVVRDIHFAIDDLSGDDISVFLAGFLIMRRGDPVAARLRALLEDPLTAAPKNLDGLEPVDLAAVLGLDLSLLERFPVAWAADVMFEVLLARGLEAADEATVLVFADIIDEWLDTFVKPPAGCRRDMYRVSPVGLERHFEDWLVENLSSLASVGYPVEIHRDPVNGKSGRQWPFIVAGRADMVCRVSADQPPLHRGDWLIVENKAVVAGPEALEQVRRYMAAARETLALGSERVFGLLLADGSTVELEDLLAADGESEAAYISLARLGYRRHLKATADVVLEAEDDPLRVLTILTEPFHAVCDHELAARDQVERRPHGPWVVGGQELAHRADANRALARELGRYDRATWEAAQRSHGLR